MLIELRTFVKDYSVIIWESQFRKSLIRYYGLKDEREISNYISGKCTFKFKVVEQPEERIRLNTLP